MQLRIYNTLSRQKEPFEPLVAGKVSLYVCGVTVYDYSHVGHARVYVFFDVVRRTLRHFGYDVKYVRNFTDVDDKIIRRANENGETCDALTSRFIEAFHKDVDERLECEAPDIEPRVTTHMPEIVAMIQEIIDRGHAYVVPGDDDSLPGGKDVYFEVSSFPAYGALSGRSQDDNQEGASDRVQHDSRKHNQADFALWKSAKANEPQWQSPWGQGRPGWHIECSAMSCKHLGSAFDLHGGGKDLIFPHHENEIAQAIAANGDVFSRGWMHLGFLTIDAEKMSKSLGNFFTIREVLDRYHPQVLRYFLLTAHYLHPLNFADKMLDETTRRVLYVYEKMALADEVIAQNPLYLLDKLPEVVQRAQTDLLNALADDFNTPQALAALSEPLSALAHALQKPKLAANLPMITAVRALIAQAGALLGVFHRPPQQVADEIVETVRERLFPQGTENLREVQDLMLQRQQAREAKDWAAADVLRAKLTERNVEVRDARDASTWRPQLVEQITE